MKIIIKVNHKARTVPLNAMHNGMIKIIRIPSTNDEIAIASS
jgi:hypothetical protein